ncbi:hypothetical protein WJ970_33945 [Achromobacter xylosoxidans]
MAMSPKSTALCLFLIGATVTADAQAATGSNPQGVILILSLVAFRYLDGHRRSQAKPP